MYFFHVVQRLDGDADVLPFPDAERHKDLVFFYLLQQVQEVAAHEAAPSGCKHLLKGRLLNQNRPPENKTGNGERSTVHAMVSDI